MTLAAPVPEQIAPQAVQQAPETLRSAFNEIDAKYSDPSIQVGVYDNTSKTVTGKDSFTGPLGYIERNRLTLVAEGSGAIFRAEPAVGTKNKMSVYIKQARNDGRLTQFNNVSVANVKELMDGFYATHGIAASVAKANAPALKR